MPLGHVFLPPWVLLELGPDRPGVERVGEPFEVFELGVVVLLGLLDALLGQGFIGLDDGVDMPLRVDLDVLFLERLAFRKGPRVASLGLQNQDFVHFDSPPVNGRYMG